MESENWSTKLRKTKQKTQQETTYNEPGMSKASYANDDTTYILRSLHYTNI